MSTYAQDGLHVYTTAGWLPFTVRQVVNTSLTTCYTTYASLQQHGPGEDLVLAGGLSKNQRMALRTLQPGACTAYADIILWSWLM